MQYRWFETATRYVVAMICAGVMIANGVVWAQGATMRENPSSPQAAPLSRSATVEETYLGLSMGPLRQAILTTLPKGLVLRAGKVEINQKQLASEIAKAPAELREKMKTNGFFVLENMVIKPFLLAEAHAWAAKTGQKTTKENADSLIKAYLQSLVGQVRVSDMEVRAFYDANPDAVSGAAYEAVAKDLHAYLLEQKQQDTITAHIQTLSARTSMEVDTTWVKRQAASMLNNPVDKARRSGKPSLIDFGREGCRPCEMMTPILEELHKTYTAQCNVLFSHVGNEPILAARYNIQSIPVQIFFDKDGHEVYRHIGFFPKEGILAKLTELGVK